MVARLTPIVVVGSVVFVAALLLVSASAISVLSGGSSAGAPTAKGDPPLTSSPSTVSQRTADELGGISTLPPADDGVPEAPAWLAYDTAVRSMYVAVDAAYPNQGENGSVVGIPSGSLDVAVTIPVGVAPFAVAFDSSDRTLWATNSGSGNVSLISDAINRTTGTFTIGGNSDPKGIAYDPTTDEMFIAASGWDSVVVVQASSATLLANVSVGSAPVGIAVDPTSGNVYVANSGSGTVSVVSVANLTRIGTIPVGTGPYGVADDPTDQEVDVSNEGSGNLTILSTATNRPVASVPLRASIGTLQGLAYDPDDGTIWVTGEGIAIVSVALHAVIEVLTFDPTGAAFDPDSGRVCVTNAANATYGCFPGPANVTRYLVTFSESGLPTGTDWAVELSAGLAGSNSTDIEFALANGTVGFSVTASAEYTADPGSGSLEVNGSAVVRSISFVPIVTTAVNFNATGLASGTLWSVTVGSAFTMNSTGATITFVLIGSQEVEYTVGAVPDYVASPTGGSFELTSGVPVNVSITFTWVGPPPPTYWVNFTQSGLPEGQNFWVTLDGITLNASPMISFLEPNGSYPFDVGSVLGYTSSPSSGTVVVDGASVLVTIVFTILTTPVELTFHESGLSNGSTWIIQLGGSVGTSAGPWVNFSVSIGGVYPFVVTSVASGGVADPSSGSVTVWQNTTIEITFRSLPSTFSLYVTPSGIYPGTPWMFSMNGSNYRSANGTFVLGGIGRGAYAYSITAPAGYSAIPRSGVIAFTQASVSIGVNFVPITHSVTLVESGLPNATWWAASLNDVVYGSPTPRIVFAAASGNYSFLIGYVAGYFASPGSGTVSVTGTNLTISVVFASDPGVPAHEPDSDSPSSTPGAAPTSMEMRAQTTRV